MDRASPIDLVTGATGLVGNNLVRLLLTKGRRIRLLVRRTSNRALFNDLNGLEFAEGDISDPKSLPAAFRGVENVYHLAADVNISRYMTPAIWGANVIGTENILKTAKSSSIHRLIYCSTVDAIGMPEDTTPSTEETTWNWDRLGIENAYARSKYEAHKIVLAAARQGLDVVLVCPTYMFGAYDARPSSGQMILAIARRQSLGYPGGGNNFVDVEDVVQGMITAAAHARAGEVYILGGQNLTYQEIFAIIARASGVPPPNWEMPYSIAWLAGQAGDMYARCSGKQANLNSAMVKVSYMKHYYNPSKAIRELSLPQTPIEVAIDRAIAWFKLQGMWPIRKS